MTQITFGIELEVIIPKSALDSNVGQYHSTTSDLPSNLFPAGWVAKRDGSLVPNTEHAISHRGIEIVSPPLVCNDAGIRQVMQVVKTLKALGAYTNRTCGGHVHVGAKSVLRDQNPTHSKLTSFAQRVVEISAALEDGIYAYNGGIERANSTYCKPVKTLWDRTVARILDRNDRYVAVNLLNLMYSRCTIEFRLFTGSLDTTVVEANIRTAVRICRMAKKNVPVTAITGMNADSIRDLQMQLWGEERYDLPAPSYL